MLRRKAFDELMRWKEFGNKPLLIYGQRQVGKTYIVDQFAKENYDTYVYTNLNEEGSFRAIFEQTDRTVDNIILSIRVLRGLKSMDPERTLIFLDEIQDCPAALSALKSFRKDGRYKVIASGSMLGVKHNVAGEKEDNVPISPMGDARVYKMYSMDFEEFLWANDIPQEAIDLVRNNIKEKKTITQPIFEQFSRLFRIYQITGGMPASVQAYVDDKTTFEGSSDELEDIVIQIGRDITQYSSSVNAIKTMECFEAIPRQLAETNKRYYYSRISTDTADTKKTRKAADKYMENLLWIKRAGYGNFCYGLDSIEAPMSQHTKKDVFRVYLSDTGILTHMYGDDAIRAIFTSDTAFNKGAITENAIAEAIMKSGYPLCYYLNNNEKNRMEVDLVSSMSDGLVAIEVKSGKDRSAPSIEKVSNVFTVARRVMFEDGNLSVSDDGIEHYPLFAASFFRDMDERPDFL